MLAACVGKELSSQVAATVAEHGYDGAPDLVLYRREPATLWFVEVKSATDSLRENQVKMMKQLLLLLIQFLVVVQVKMEHNQLLLLFQKMNLLQR